MGLADFAFISFYVLVALSTVASRAPDDCSGGSCCSNSTYIEINEPRRSIKSSWKAGQVALCDRRLRRGWYRFTSFVGGKMPENKVLPNNCGTHAPIWLKGTHPSKEGENVVRRACINVLNIFPDGCFDSFNINITKCPGGYFVYYLRPPWYCSAGYCAGYKEPCPYGTEGEPPNCYDFPKDFSSDNIENPEIIVQEGENVSVTLLCKANILNGIASWKNVTYKIEWFAEGNSSQVETICGGIPPGSSNGDACPNGPLVSKLSGSKYKIGNWISCNVSAMFTTSPKNVWSPSKAVREPFFAGIQVYPRTTLLRVQTCSLSIQTITFIPKIPARRNALGWPIVEFWLPKEIQLVDNNQCKVQLEGTKNVSIAIKATCPDGQVTEGLKAIVPQMKVHSKLWNPQTGLPTIWVTVLKPKGDNIQTCTSVTDPRITALGANRYFDFMGLGDFILYKNMERKFEVHTRQWACDNQPFPIGGHNGAGRTSCNCGAVLRDHNDVIEFSCCNQRMVRDKRTPITVKIRSKKCLSPGISIKKVIPGINGKYEVLFPSGAKVVIRRNKWGLDVVIKTPRANDTNQEGGLCVYPGPYGIRITDAGFMERLEVGKSYFDTLPVDVRDEDVAYSSACLCQQEEGNDDERICQSVFKAAFPTLVREDNMTPVNPKHASPSSLCDRQKRDIHYSDDITHEDLQLYKQTLHLHSRFKRSVAIKQIPKENATRYCATRISDTELGKLCAKIGVNVQELVDICSADVELTGDLAFASGSVSLLVEQCGVLGAKNLSILVNGSDEGNPAAAEAFVEQVAELLCPNDCTLNGKCINGSCVCYKDYTASDCSMSIYQKPEIYRLQEDGLCDRRRRSCKKVTVFGVDFRNSTNMTCHINEFKVLNSSWKPNGTELRFPGVMTDLVLVDCYLPESQVTQGYFSETDEGTAASGLIISLSNDGEHKSQENLTFISFDSACMSCNISSGCLFKGNSCLINGYCFAPNETNPLGWCYQCLPEVSTSTWTKRQVNLPPKFSPTSDYFAVSGETLELAIDVTDPEGMPVTLSLMQGSPTNASVVDSVLTWKATNDASTQFFLKAADACQSTSYANITVSLVVCQCQNNGTCVPHPNKPRGSGFYACNCLPGFTGGKCETNIDECQSFPCFRGRCIDGVNSYECICDSGYVGRDCDTDYDDCSSSPCAYGNCTDFVGTYRCTCDPGYSGPNCTIDVNECDSSPCVFGTCVDHVNKYTCVCNDGYKGYDCEDEVDECLSSPCIRGTCVDKINSFNCICPTGFSGVRCDYNIDDCLAIPCVNGTCIDLVNNYTCNCFAGFTGSNCDIKIENCTDDSCYPNVTCFKNSEIISCGPCPLGFTGDGKNCKDIDHCVSHECKNNGSCVDGISNYTCSCLDGFAGGRCEIDIDDCVNHTCANGGSCLDGVHNYLCSCMAGFTGDRCGTDIDDCMNHTCTVSGGSCVDGVNNYSCLCLVGFTGDHCETNIDDCANHSCANGATCVDGTNDFSCNCIPGYTGKHCETDIDDCANHTCINGASCVDLVNNFSCSCMAGFSGDLCETDINECANHSCANGATCVDGTNNFSCNCIPGYTGKHCEIVVSSVNEQSSLHTSLSPSASRVILSKTNVAVIPATTHVFASSFSTLISASPKISPTSSSKELGIFSSVGKLFPTTDHKKQKTSAPPTTNAPRTKEPSKEKVTTDTPETDEPKTKEPTTEEIKTELIVELRVKTEWNDELKEKSSAAFKKLSQEFGEEIQELYFEDDNFIAVEILSFKKGSVLVEFKLTFRKRLENSEALAPLKEGIKGGRMGSWSVDPESLKVNEQGEGPTESSFPLPMVIGISCGGFLFLSLTTICIVRQCQRSKGKIKSRRSDGMPTEIPLPILTSYTLNDEKDGNAPYEEKPISHIGNNRYEALGISNEAVHYEKLDALSPPASRYEDLGTLNEAASFEEVNLSNNSGEYKEISSFNNA